MRDLGSSQASTGSLGCPENATMEI
jgi:hypothetical protein